MIMMTNTPSLQDFKERRKLEVVSQDLDTVLYLFKLIKSGLQDYSVYVPVRDVYITICNNEQLLKKHLEKINVRLDKIYEIKESPTKNNN